MSTIKINGTNITKPYYPEDKRCVYCNGDSAVDKTPFEVKLKNGTIITHVCNVCLTEYIFEDCKVIDTIKNIEIRDFLNSLDLEDE